jgi:DNA-binding NarL/FixJ family response regulator
VVVTGLDLLSLSGVELIRQLTELGAGRSPRVVVYAMNDADDIVADVLHAGANGLLVKNAHRGELAAAIRAVANGEAVLAPSVARRLLDWFRRRDSRPDVALGRVVATLTRREQEVLLLLARGMQPEEIAGKLFIGVTTVRTHIYRLRNKLSLKDRAQLVSFAYRAGLVQAEMAGDSYLDEAHATSRQLSRVQSAAGQSVHPLGQRGASHGPGRVRAHLAGGDPSECPDG